MRQKIRALLPSLYGLLFGLVTLVPNAHSVVETSDLLVASDADISVQLAGGRYNRRTGETQYTATITNLSASAFAAPLYLVISDISVAAITVNNADDTTSAGDAAFLISSTDLAPGQMVTLPIIFGGSRLRFSYNSTVYYTDTGSPNTAPRLNAIGNQQVRVGETLGFTASAEDDEGNPLMFQFAPPLSNASLDPNSGVFSFSPVAGQEGTTTHTVTVDDGDLDDSETFDIAVLPEEVGDMTPPQISITSPLSGALVILSRPAIMLTYSDASGVNTASLALTANGNPLPADCVVDAAGGECTPTSDLPEGDVTIAASVDDNAGNSGSTQVAVVVDSVPISIEITSPADGLITSADTAEVTGDVSAGVTSVDVNGVAASLGGGGFIATVPLREGKNMLVALATKASGRTGTDTVDVTRDIVAPIVSIDSPSDGFVSVNDSIAVAGKANDIVTGGVEPRVSVNGIEATSGGGSYMVMDVPLVRGPNTITAVATDAVGNVGTRSITVTYQPAVGARMSEGSGNGQAEQVNMALPQPLIALVQDDLGNPVAGRVVQFEVTRNNGSLQPGSGDAPKRIVQVPTDGSGKASVIFTLGDTSGEGNNRVRASAVGVAGEVEFCATALGAPPDKILMVDGDNQRGVVGFPLANPLEALVVDRDGNPINGIDVTFTVVKGTGNLDGELSQVKTTGSDGVARAVLTLGLEAGINNNVVSASYVGLTGLPANFSSSGLAPGNPADTRFSGVVLDSGLTAIPGAVVTIPGSAASDTTDEDGQFLLSGVPVGHIHLRIDPTGSPRPETFPPLEFETVTVAGQNNILGQAIVIPALQTEGSRLVGGSEDVTLKMPGVAGLELTVFANSVTCKDGSSQCQVSISQVHLDKVPMPPPSGTFFMPPAWTVQPAGTLFDPPARISIPNDGLPPGRVIDIFQFDHTLNEFINVGKGTVSEDGLVIVSDPGFGITRAGWGGCGQPQPPITCASGCDDGNPCTDDKCENNSCVHTNMADGTACEAGKNNSFTISGVKFKVDKSCSKGTCDSGACSAKSDRWGFDNIKAQAEDALSKVYDDPSCMGPNTQEQMEDYLDGLGDGGYSINCVDDGDTNGNGTNDCASAALGGSGLNLSNLEAGGCGSLAKTLRHEIQHSSGDGHTAVADAANDPVYGCDLACYGVSNRAGASADSCD